MEGNLGEAEKYFILASKEAKVVFGERDPHVASSLNNLLIGSIFFFYYALVAIYFNVVFLIPFFHYITMNGHHGKILPNYSNAAYIGLHHHYYRGTRILHILMHLYHFKSYEVVNLSVIKYFIYKLSLHFFNRVSALSGHYSHR